MARYRVTFEVEVVDETSSVFQPGRRDAFIVGTDMHAVGATDTEAVGMLVMFMLQGHYRFEQWGEPTHYARSVVIPPCEIVRVDEKGDDHD